MYDIHLVVPFKVNRSTVYHIQVIKIICILVNKYLIASLKDIVRNY